MNDRRDISLSAGVFDIETEDWDRLVCAGHLGDDGGYKSWTWEKEDECADYILGLQGHLWAHNGGRYDCKWILDHALKRSMKVQVTLSGGTVIRARVNKRLTVLDSKALFKLSLKDLTDATDVKKAETGLPCVCGKKCGGYCSIRRGMRPELFRKLLSYLEQDCRSLYAAMQHFREYASANDLDLCSTVGSSAWRNANRMLGLREADIGNVGHKIVRSALHGGRVQVFQPEASSGFEVDVNSMYPSRLALEPVPIGRSARYAGQDARRAFDDGAEGVFRASVHVPDMHIPPLPFGSPSGRITYPTGSFRGTWSGPELRYARDLGCDVDPFESITWEGSRIVFADWVDKLWKLRAGAPGGKSGALGTWLKFVMNSLTGKLGANPMHENVIFDPGRLRFCTPGRGDRHWPPCTSRDNADCGKCCLGKYVNGAWCRPHCSGHCGAHKLLYPELNIYTQKSWRLETNSHPEWACYLTSASRVLLHRQLVADGQGGRSAVYCDTDSVLSTERRSWLIGKELGEFEDKGEFHDFVALAPKVYSLERGGKTVVRAKGIMLEKGNEKAGFEALRRGEEVGSARHGIIGFRTGARKGKFFVAAKKLRRLNGRGYGDRILTGDGTTRAPTIEECARL